MEYRKTGRGGAGNYRSQQDVEKAAKEAAKVKDLEAQKINEPVLSEIQDHKSAVAHAGRGGAGNTTDRETLAKATTQNADVTPGLQERRPSKTGYQGRGGAGNYKDQDAEKAAEQIRRANENAERSRQEAVEMVDLTLKEPEQVHLGGQDRVV